MEDLHSGNGLQNYGKRPKAVYGKWFMVDGGWIKGI
jgi:hypothetical protein